MCTHKFMLNKLLHDSTHVLSVWWQRPLMLFTCFFFLKVVTCNLFHLYVYEICWRFGHNGREPDCICIKLPPSALFKLLHELQWYQEKPTEAIVGEDVRGQMWTPPTRVHRQHQNIQKHVACLSLHCFSQLSLENWLVLQARIAFTVVTKSYFFG